MEPTYEDDVGRMFCEKHRREVCHDCCFDFEMTNRMAEEDAGLRKKRTPLEEIAEDVASAIYALKGMQRMVPLPSQERFETNKKYLKEKQAEFNRLEAEDGSDKGQEALAKAMAKEETRAIEKQGLMQALQKRNPGQTRFEYGGPETQELYDEFLGKPAIRDDRAEKFTCAFCGKTSKEKLDQCAQCKMVCYCSRECQKAAWKAHKPMCVAAGGGNIKAMPLTWAQVEAHGGMTVDGRTLTVKAVLDESMMRDVFSCKDRTGATHRVAAYTHSRKIPGLAQGKTLRWKNPRFHWFMDGSAGARIEEDDLINVKVVNA